MKKIAQDYYADLKIEYAKKIRQLVPRYDDMVQCMVELLQHSRPRTVLDIGAGVGNVTQTILNALPETRVTAVDACEDMVAEARRALGPYGDRVTIVQADAAGFTPEAPFDAVFSNLVLHNVPFAPKHTLLRSIIGWLNPGGVFLWGDMIRHADPSLQEYFVRQRKEFALAAGCAKELVAANFEKEETEDYPFTLQETLQAAKQAGFREANSVWMHDTFAVFVLVAEAM
ncbi:MAG: methyltransferase domain-containing protein [Gemmatimonadales bacterium]|nr:methyltransferase domain-containing protein [Gemmatimonadales bacterium]